MQVIQSMEAALDDCSNDAADNAKAWDEAVAFYVGSLTKVSRGQSGNFLYTHAQRRCRNFQTCDGNGDAQANADIMEQFQLGQSHIFGKRCSDAREAKNRIVEQMTVPMIQGTLRYAYMMDRDNVVDSRAQATGATYAASVLPLVHKCNPVDAQIIYSNMRVGHSGRPNFDLVKAAFERSYKCLNLSCMDVGGISGANGYMPGAAVCDDSTLLDTSSGSVGEVISVTSSPTATPVAVVNETASEGPVESQVPEMVATTVPSSATTMMDESVVVEETSSSCPPCSLASDETGDVAVTKASLFCTALLVEQASQISQGCDCACFVDAKFAFCAQPEILYTGSGEVVGPCQMSSTESIVEEDTSMMTTESPEEDTNDAVVQGVQAGAQQATEGPSAGDDLVGEEQVEDGQEPALSFLQSQNRASAAPAHVLLGSISALVFTVISNLI